ncbi:hypothetical protein CYMTET_41423 [Cymbomonas tetramitiformis]|uniref:Uncharacterized protein n=1 Tax=Cymbomonas tetramitiformis TaxID=36881 RepID=A0AAE0F3N2_9CHLO|nr:hypothetical protein CYMTET_41423 [Cymbomonas tetramitiformis]
MILREIRTVEYETPLKGALYKVPQEKIRNVDRKVWTEHDIRGSMVSAFSTGGDGPRRVKAVSVDTPLVAAITLDNEDDMDHFDLSLVAGFLIANDVNSPKFVPFTESDKTQQTKNVIDNPCNLKTYHENGDLIGMSTLFKDESADVYSQRLTPEVRALLDNSNNSNYFVDNEIFKINENLKTEPITMNKDLNMRDGAQNILLLPFLPKFTVSNGRPIDSYETRICMIVEMKNYVNQSKTAATARKLLQVTVSTEAGGVLDLQIAILSQDYPVSTCGDNCSYSNESNSNGNLVFQMTKSTASGSQSASSHTDNDDTFTNTNWKLSISLMVLSCTAALLLIALVSVYWYRSSMRFEAD